VYLDSDNLAIPSTALSSAFSGTFSGAFSGLVGQFQAVTLLQRAIALGRIAPGYLFVGPAGTGKALAARSFAALLLSFTTADSDHQDDGAIRDREILARRIGDHNHPDLLWVEPTYLHQGQLFTASQAAETGLKRKSLPSIRLSQIREVARFLSRPALESPRAVVVIDQAELMAEAAANALLKTLEEPGAATVILLAQQALLPTLVSRCQTIPFRRLNPEQMVQVLTQSGHAEILQAPEVMAISQGSPGRAIESWQILRSLPPDLLDQLAAPTSLRAALENARDIAQTLDTEAQLWLIDYLQQRYWQQGLSDATQLAALEKVRSYLLSYVQPRLVWEVTLARLACR
jgi:DNA polymerase-3 subunit delta'